jgi:formate dehydrogenase accessory protein FdhD
MPSVKTSRKLNCWQLTNGIRTLQKASVVIEQEFPIYVNGKILVTASITPGFEREFALGYLYGQGFINSMDEVTSIEIISNTAHVNLKDKRKMLAGTDKTNYRIVSGGGRTAYSAESTLPQIKSDVVVSKRTIFSAMKKLFTSALLYLETEGVHTAGLFNTKAMPICIAEDIGRHNTLDKIIGYTLLHKVDCSRAFIVSTGRMASEMVTKIARSGIPIVATKTAVTDKGLDIAKKSGLTLVGFVRAAGSKANTDMDIRVFKDAGMKIYCGAERIRCT